MEEDEPMMDEGAREHLIAMIDDRLCEDGDPVSIIREATQIYELRGHRFEGEVEDSDIPECSVFTREIVVHFPLETIRVKHVREETDDE